MGDGKRELKVVVLGDVKSAQSAFRNLESSTETLGGKLGALGGRMTDLGGKFTKLATIPVAAGLAFSTKAASDLNEAVNVTGLVFGGARGEIDRFVKTTATGLGQSERAAREATATFGGLLTNLGLAKEEAVDWSMKLTTLASDLGSAFNKDPAEAVEALGAALRGETEPIRAYNVMLDDATIRQKAVAMGLAETAAEVDKTGKAQAALALITEQTAAVQGDFANTSDGLANKSRILKARLEDTAAALGAKLLPFALKAVGVVQDMVDWFGNLDPILQNVALGAALVVASLGPLLSVSGNVIKAVTGIGQAMVFMATTSSMAGVAAVSLGGALAGLLVGYAALRATIAAVKTASDDLIASQAVATNTAALGADATKEQAIAAYEAAAGINSHTDAVKGGTIYGKAFAEIQREAKENLDAMSEATGVSRERIVELANEMGINLGHMSDTAKEKLGAALATISGGVGPTERLAKVQKTLGSETATTSESLDAFKEALDAVFASVLDADEASLRYQEKIVALGKAITENGPKFGLATEQQRNVTQATLDAIRAAEAEVQAFTDAGRVAGDAASQKQALIDRLEGLKAKFPQLAGPIDGYIAKLREIPTTQATTVTADVSDAERKLRELRDLQRSIDLNMKIKAGVHTNPGPGRPAARAHGGPVFAGQLYQVGEEGVEYLQMGSVSGFVHPNSATGGDGLGGVVFAAGAITTPVYGNVDQATIAELERRVHGAVKAGVDEAMAEQLRARRRGAGARRLPAGSRS